MDAKHIYTITARFVQAQWREFVNSHLDLEEQDIKELEEKCEKTGDFANQKFETILRWTKKNELGENALLKLIALTESFFTHDIRKSLPASKQEFSQDQTMVSSAKGHESTSTYLSTDTFRYPVTKKGLVLIICNSFRPNDGDRSEGCYRDKENMEKLWRETLKCDLVDDKVHMDKTADEMRKLLRAMDSHRKGHDYVVVVISSHGGMVPIDSQTNHHQSEGRNGVNPEKYEEVICGNDWSKLSADEIQLLYRNQDSPNLKDIPKFFILQYCRGELVDRGEKREDKADTGGINEVRNPVYRNQLDPLMPSVSDILIAYPTHKRFTSFRNNMGSWFISNIYEVFMEHHEAKHVVDMLTIVNDRMKNKSGEIDNEKCKAMSIFESSLTKDFYLTTQL